MVTIAIYKKNGGNRGATESVCAIYVMLYEIWPPGELISTGSWRNGGRPNGTCHMLASLIGAGSSHSSSGLAWGLARIHLVPLLSRLLSLQKLSSILLLLGPPPGSRHVHHRLGCSVGCPSRCSFLRS